MISWPELLAYLTAFGIDAGIAAVTFAAYRLRLLQLGHTCKHTLPQGIILVALLLLGLGISLPPLVPFLPEGYSSITTAQSIKNIVFILWLAMLYLLLFNLAKDAFPPRRKEE